MTCRMKSEQTEACSALDKLPVSPSSLEAVQ